MLKNNYISGGQAISCVVTPLVTSERKIEERLVAKAKAHKGLALKWVAPAFAGVPDRIVFLPGGRVVFVELKRPGGVLSPLQVRVMGMLRELGADVRVIDSYGGVDALFV